MTDATRLFDQVLVEMANSNAAMHRARVLIEQMLKDTLPDPVAQSYLLSESKLYSDLIHKAEKQKRSMVRINELLEAHELKHD